MLTIEQMKGSIFEGDCLEVMRQFPDSSVDMVLCDLPYGSTQSKWDSIIDLDALWKQYRRIVKPDGAIVLTSQGLFTCQLGMSAPDLFKYKWVWEKAAATNFLNAKKQPLRKHEDVCVFYRRQPVYNPQMTEGEPYTLRNFRKGRTTACYGQVSSVISVSEGARYPVDIFRFNNARYEGGGGRRSIRIRNRWDWGGIWYARTRIRAIWCWTIPLGPVRSWYPPPWRGGPFAESS